MTNAWKFGDSNSYTKGWADGGAGSIAFTKVKRPTKPYVEEVMQKASSNIGAGGKGGYQYVVGNRPIDLIIDKFRQRLVARGARGFIGLARQFKIMDDNNSKSLDMDEFQKAMKDFRVDLNANQIG